MMHFLLLWPQRGLLTIDRHKRIDTRIETEFA